MKELELLREMAEIANKYDCYHLAKVVLENPKFMLWTGTANPQGHHYGKGGLVQHVYEVLKLCFVNNAQLATWNKAVDEKELYLAVVFHDYGKLWDYEPADYAKCDQRGTFTGWYVVSFGTKPNVERSQSTLERA